MVKYVPTSKRKPQIRFPLEDYYSKNRKKAVNMVIMLYFKKRKTHPNISHIIQLPHLLHVSIWNATKSGCERRKIIQKLLVERWPSPCSVKYYKPPNKNGRPRSFLFSIKMKNEALLTKWIWRYHHEEKVLWIVKAKYCNDPFFHASNHGLPRRRKV